MKNWPSWALLSLIVALLALGLIGFFAIRDAESPELPTFNGGLCVEHNYDASPSIYVESINTPTIQNGVMSCQVGVFTPFTPVNLDDMPPGGA